MTIPTYNISTIYCYMRQEMKNHTVGNFMLSTLTYLFHGQSPSVILLVECSHNIVPDRLMYGLQTLLVPL